MGSPPARGHPARAEQRAREAGLTIAFIRRTDFRKEARIKALLADRGNHPGPGAHLLDHKTLLKPTDATCLRYYSHFIDPEFGVRYLRVPTWAALHQQSYLNGHNCRFC